MKKIFMFVLFVLVLIPFKVNAGTWCREIRTDISNYEIGIFVNKIDSEDGNVLDGANFIISTLDGNFVFETNQEKGSFPQRSRDKLYNIMEKDSLTEDESDGKAYHITGNKTLSNDELYNILPQSIKNLYDSINTVDDFYNIIDGVEYKMGYSSCKLWVDEEDIARHTVLNTYVYFPIKIVETKSPINYQKTEVVYAAIANLYFNYKENEDVIDNKQIQITITSYNYYKYDNSVNYMDYVTDSTSLYEYLENNAEKYDGFIPNEKGTIDLKIDNTIENKYIYETGTNKRFTYKIIIENEGTASSGNDEIKIVVPKELEVYEDSISDDGKFNSKKNEIIWKLDYIDSNEKKELSFDIKAPSNSAGEYTLISSLNNNESSLNAPKITLKVKGKASNSDTIKNPDTGVSDYSSIMFIVIILSIGLYGFLKQKKDYLIK